MQPSERRRKIIERPRFGRHDTTPNPARELGVSRDTTHRDIQIMLTEYPLILTQGTGGGVALPAGYYITQRHLTAMQADALRRSLAVVCASDRELLESILSDFA